MNQILEYPSADLIDRSYGFAQSELYLWGNLNVWSGNLGNADEPILPGLISDISY